jgi:putative thioredoxin
MHNTTEKKFFDDVLRPSYQKPVVVMFHASWCSPCQAMKPVIERLAAEYGFTLVGVDGGEERDLAAYEGVRGVPALLIYKGGKAFGQPLVGGQTAQQLRAVAWLLNEESKCSTGS